MIQINTTSLRKVNGQWTGPIARRLGIGDRVLHEDDLRFAWVVADLFINPDGQIRIVIEPENLPDGLAPVQMTTCVNKLIPAPVDWQDAPPRPNCRGGRFDGVMQDEKATAEWMAKARRWDIEHRQPLVAKLRLAPMP